jgi:tetratricopeptide (TPR) repeat protein
MLKALDRVILQVPDEPEFRSWRARLLNEKGEYEKAMADLNHPSLAGSARTELFLGMAEYGLNGLAAALAHFDKAIALEPGDPATYLYAGSYCLDEERYEEADAYFSAGLSRASDNLDLMMYKGYTLVELKQVEEGCRLLRKAFYSGHEDAGDYLNEYCFRYSR